MSSNAAIFGDRHGFTSHVKLPGSLEDKFRERMSKLPSTTAAELAGSPLLATLQKKYGVDLAIAADCAKATHEYVLSCEKLPPIPPEVLRGPENESERLQMANDPLIFRPDRAYLTPSREHPPAPKSPARTLTSFADMLTFGRDLASKVLLALVSKNGNGIALRVFDETPAFGRKFVELQLLRYLEWPELLEGVSIAPRERDALRAELKAAVLRVIGGAP